MLQIMDNLHNYVPVKSTDEEIDISGSKLIVKREVLHQILCGGDQLTVSRLRGCQLIRMNSVSESTKLSGLLPVAEDWHTKVILLEVTSALCLDYIVYNSLIFYRLFGRGYTPQCRHLIMVLYNSCGTLLIDEMLYRTLTRMSMHLKTFSH